MLGRNTLTILLASMVLALPANAQVVRHAAACTVNSLGYFYNDPDTGVKNYVEVQSVTVCADTSNEVVIRVEHGTDTDSRQAQDFTYTNREESEGILLRAVQANADAQSLLHSAEDGTRNTY